MHALNLCDAQCSDSLHMVQNGLYSFITGEKTMRSTTIPLPFRINPLGILGAAASSGKVKRCNDAFEDKDKGGKRPKTSNMDFSTFKFSIKETGTEGDVSDATATEDREEKSHANASTVFTASYGERTREFPTGGGTTGASKKLKRKQAEIDPLHSQRSLKKDGKHSSLDRKFDSIQLGKKAQEVGSGSDDDNICDASKDVDKAQTEDMSVLIDDEEESYQTDRSGAEGPDDDGQQEDRMGRYSEPQGSQDYRFGIDVYGDTLGEHSQGGVIGVEDEEKEPLVSGLFMDLDDSDVHKDGKDTSK